MAGVVSSTEYKRAVNDELMYTPIDVYVANWFPPFLEYLLITRSSTNIEDIAYLDIT